MGLFIASSCKSRSSHGLVTVTENVLRTRVKPPNTHGIVEDMCYERDDELRPVWTSLPITH